LRRAALLFAAGLASAAWVSTAVADEAKTSATAQPNPCPGGRFVLPQDTTPLVIGGSVIGPDAVTVVDGKVGIASGCGETFARLRVRKHHVLVKATWPTCGTARRVRLKSRIQRPSCNSLTGRVKVKGARAVHFEAALETASGTTTTSSMATTSSSSTSSSNPSTSSTTTTATTSTTSTTCIDPCAAVFAECGELDNGCGTAIFCGECPPDRPTCLDAHCYPVCATAPSGTPCEYGSDRCTQGACNDGSCEPASVTVCPPTPCYADTSCDPATGACEPATASYAGDGVSCLATLLGPLGFCHQGGCDTAIGCWMDGTPWAVNHPNPANLCEACQPGFSRTAWSDAETGTPCPNGLCVAGTCEDDVCVIEGVTYDAGDGHPEIACRSCQPGTSRRTWTTVGNGGPCTDGVCVDGSCKQDVCVISGAVYSAGTTNPSNLCQNCDPAASRSGWTTLPDNSVCGSGCLVGICQALFGCSITGTSGCPSTDCSVGACDPNTGQCLGTPRNPGSACSQLTTNGCQATDGTCDAFGGCIRPALTGQGCIPAEHADACREADTGVCNASGQCVPDPKPTGTDCRPADGGDLCAAYTCQELSGLFACWSSKRTDFSNVCPTAAGCNAVQCEPSTGACYADPPDPSGTRVCENVFGQAPCCWGQECRCPPGSGQFCVEKFCYSGPPL
jgi:hypothetical protein